MFGRCGSDGRGQRQRRLDGAPERATARPMRGDALGHLSVARFRSREIRAGSGGVLDEALGIAALARAGATQHQSYSGEPQPIRGER